MCTKKIALTLFIAASLLGCTSTTPLSDTSNASAQTLYFKSLSDLCKARFEGEMTYPKDGQDSFAGKLLVATISQCEENEIRIPFVVGEDHSRTWIISKTETGLQLKHDHRHEDGTPDAVNMYGGLTQQKGSALSQAFHADQHTANIIPEATTNVWSITLSDDLKSLTYYLERHSAPRFKAELRRVDSLL